MTNEYSFVPDDFESTNDPFNTCVFFSTKKFFLLINLQKLYLLIYIYIYLIHEFPTYNLFTYNLTSITGT